MIFPIALAAWLCLGTPIEAATYYVSLSGNDSNSCGTATSTTQSQQKLTIAAGVACAVAGDTVSIHGGTYTGSGATIDSQGHTVNSGSSWSNPITISAVTGETAIIRPPSNVSAVRLYNSTTSYVIIQNLTLDMVNSGMGTTAEGIIFGGDTLKPHHIRVENCNIENGWSFGIHSGSGVNFLHIRNNLVHDFGGPSSAPGDAHGMYMSGNDSIYEGNDVYNNGGYGIHIYNNFTFSPDHSDPVRNIVRNNKSHHNGLEYPSATTYGIVVAWGDSNQVYNNLVYNNLDGGIQIYTGSTNTLVANNTIYGHPNKGISLQFYGSGTILRNNIIYNNGQNIVDDSGAPGYTADHNLITNPLFTNAAGGDFTLAAGSLALDRGAAIPAVLTDIAGTSRPQNGSYDIGAYESGAGAQQPPVGEPHPPTSVHVSAALIPTLPTTSTPLNVGDTFQTAVAAGAEGQVFLIKTGTHRLQSITPKNNQAFVFETGAVMSGARLLTSPTGSSPWAYTGQTQQGSTAGTCRSGQPECQHPEDVFFDDVPLHHVSTLGEVTAGTWFFNYVTDTIYIGDNPSGHTVEASVTPAAFISEGSIVSGVTISHFTIEKYATVGNKATISAPNGQSWTLTDGVCRLSHATCIGLGSHATVRNVNAHHNGQAGIGAYNATGQLYETLELSYNGAFFDPFWGAGGMKVTLINNSTIRAVHAHHNYGPGIWADIDCNVITIENSTPEDNDQAGIIYEISFNGLIRNNTVRRNGFTAGSGPAQAGIFIAASPNVEVSGNTVEDNAWGIFAYQEARGSSPVYGLPYQIHDLNVHNNVVKTAGSVGFTQTVSDSTYFTAKNNHFEGNTYTLQTNTNKFAWSNVSTNSFATWQGFGNDSPSGSASTY